MAANSPDLDVLIDIKIDQFIKLRLQESNKGIIVIQFLDKSRQHKKKTGWFGKLDLEELKVWESWVLTINCLPAGSVDHRSTITNFEECLRKIMDDCDTHKDHIPAITSLDISPFEYSINVGDDGQGVDESWGKYIKKILD